MDVSGSSFVSSNTVFILVLLVVIIFILTISVLLIYTVLHTVKSNRMNNQSPVITVDATLVVKRKVITEKNRLFGSYNNTEEGSTALYYATFQVESGDRVILAISHNEYGFFAEGDTGKLIFQGTKFLGFAR